MPLERRAHDINGPVSRTALGIAVIGCGYWGGNYLRALNELPRVRLVAACDQLADALARVQYRYPSVDVTTNVDEVLARPDVDAVVLCTQAETHCELGVQAIQAGKHVLVEKPLATTSADAQHLINVARATGLTLMVGHTFLYNPAVAKVMEYVAGRASGPIYYLYARRTNLGPIRADVNAAWDLAPHDVSIFNFLVGSEPEWVSAVGARPLGTSREDVVFVTLGYPDEVLGHVHVSWADPNKTREVVIVCEEKRIVFNDLDSLEPVRVFEKGVRRRLPLNTRNLQDPVFALREGRIVSPVVEAAEPLARQCEHFVWCVETGAQPLTDGYAGLGVVRVMEALDRSLARSGAPVSLAPAPERRGVERDAGTIG